MILDTASTLGHDRNHFPSRDNNYTAIFRFSKGLCVTARLLYISVILVIDISAINEGLNVIGYIYLKHFVLRVGNILWSVSRKLLVAAFTNMVEL